MAQSTSSKIGVNVGATTTAPLFVLGEVVTGTQDTVWTYVQMNGAATTGHCCSINTTGTATPCLTSGGSSVAFSMIGFAQNTFADADYGWLCQKGNNVYVRASGTISPSGVLYIAVTSGCIHTTSASGTLAGVAILANTSSTATSIAVLANLTWPKFVNVGQ